MEKLFKLSLTSEYQSHETGKSLNVSFLMTLLEWFQWWDKEERDQEVKRRQSQDSVSPA